MATQPRSVRPETRERILAAARDLNYRPNALARGLKTAKTMTIGMVIPHLAYPVNAELIRGSERAAAAAGYVMLLADADEFMQSGEAYRRLLLEQRTDGLLIASASTTEPFLEELSSHGLPFVLVNRRSPRAGPSVTVDDVLGMRTAVGHLVELGHQRIALSNGPGGRRHSSAPVTGFPKGHVCGGARGSRGLCGRSRLSGGGWATGHETAAQVGAATDRRARLELCRGSRGLCGGTPGRSADTRTTYQ